jgi:hypothetical protein
MVMMPYARIALITIPNAMIAASMSTIMKSHRLIIGMYAMPVTANILRAIIVVMLLLAAIMVTLTSRYANRATTMLTTAVSHVVSFVMLTPSHAATRMSMMIPAAAIVMFTLAYWLA